jgi:hypothetical protein
MSESTSNGAHGSGWRRINQIQKNPVAAGTLALYALKTSTWSFAVRCPTKALIMLKTSLRN